MRLFCVCCKSHSDDWNCHKNDFREKKNEIRPMIKIIASSIFIVSVGWFSSLAINSFTHKSVSTSPISFHYPICSAIHPIKRSRTKNSQTMANSNKHLSIHFHFCFLSTRFLCFMHHCIPIINCVIIYLYSSFVCLLASSFVYFLFAVLLFFVCIQRIIIIMIIKADTEATRLDAFCIKATLTANNKSNHAKKSCSAAQIVA